MRTKPSAMLRCGAPYPLGACRPVLQVQGLLTVRRPVHGVVLKAQRLYLIGLQGLRAVQAGRGRRTRQAVRALV